MTRQLTDQTIKSSRDTFLPFSPPAISKQAIDAVVDTPRSSWITTGPKTKTFEAEFSTYVNATAALGVNSCTGALHIALAALGIGPGDEVITTPIAKTGKRDSKGDGVTCPRRFPAYYLDRWHYRIYV